MSQTEPVVLDHTEQDVEGRESGLLTREFRATSLEVAGRTVDVLLVPFGEVAIVADPPEFVAYREEWMPGAFDHQLTAAHRIEAKYGHSGNILDVVGHGISLRREAGGYHLSSKLHETPQGNIALELIRDGVLPCVSLEAKPRRATRTASGVLQRTMADLRAFAFCKQGAFAGARVLALRAAEEAPDEVIVDSDLVPFPPDQDLLDRAMKAGIEIPQMYRQPEPDEAHPAPTDTPDESGTSEQ